MESPKVSRHISNISMGIKSRSATLSLYQLFSLKLLYSLSLWGAPQDLSDCIWFLNGLPALASLPPVDHRLPKARMLGGALSFPVAILLVENLTSMEAILLWKSLEGMAVQRRTERRQEELYVKPDACLMEGKGWEGGLPGKQGRGEKKKRHLEEAGALLP